jgi:hypothetical protein
VAESGQFSISDADALLKVIYSSPSGRIVIVGGQAVNFWADRYTPDELKLLAFLPFTSRDLDLLADIANAYRLATETSSTVEKPRRRAASPVLANVEVKTEHPEIYSVFEVGSRGNQARGRRKCSSIPGWRNEDFRG